MTLAIGMLLTAVLMLAAAGEANRQERLHLDTFRGDLVDLARISEAIVSDRLRQFDHSLLMLRGANSVDPQLVAERLRLLRSGPLADREVMFVLIDRTGHLAYTDAPNVKPGLDRGDQSYFRYFSEGGADRFYVSEPVFGRVTQRYSLPLVRPVFDAQGSFLGVVALSVRQDSLTAFGTRLSPAGDPMVTIVTKSGAVVSRSRDLAKIQGTTLPAELMAPLLGTGEGVVSSRAIEEGVERYVAHRHLEGLPLIVIVSASPGEVLHQTAVLRAGLLSGAALLSLTILSLLLINIKRRKIAARYLATQRSHLQAAQRIAGMGSWELDGERGTFIWSDEVYVLLGVSLEEFRPNLEHYLALVPAAERATVQSAYTQALSEGKLSLEHAIRRGDGQVRDMVLRGEALRAKGGKATILIGTVQDVTERKRAEEAVQVSESRLREAQLIGKMGNWELDVASGSLWWSDEVYELFGLPSRSGITFERFLGIVDPDDRQRVEASIRASLEQRLAAWQFDYRIVRGGAEVRFMHESATADLDDDGRVVRRRGIVQDVTERMILEAQLRHAQKMEAIGTLAGGVAHDFNNILNVIKGYGFLLERGAEPGGALAGYVREVLAATERGVDLTGSLLAFSRRQETATAVIGLNAIVRGMQGMSARILGEEVRIELVLAPEEPLVEGDAAQFGQVLMNLVTNARDAMPHGGTLAIRTETLMLSAPLVLSDFTLAAGSYAVLRVSDCGLGMTDEVRRRIFEPFFTTKESGRGTGLGLAVVFGILKQNHGFIECTSAPGAGTAFAVYLPLVEGTARIVDPLVAQEVSLPGGKERLLIAEDDEAGRRMLSLVLSERGYAVTTACDGAEAIRLLTAAPAAFDLLLLDLVMPNSSGLDVLEHAMRLRPGIPAILMSGYSDEVIKERGLPLASIPILRKPVDIEALGVLIRETLDQAASGGGAR